MNSSRSSSGSDTQYVCIAGAKVYYDSFALGHVCTTTV